MVGLSTLVVDALEGEPGIGAENVDVASGIDMGMCENGGSDVVGMKMQQISYATSQRTPML
jgi:hypothetical protein